MPKLRAGTIFPTMEEDAQINAGITANPDAYELSDTEFRQLRPLGRPKAAVTKERIRLLPQVISYLRDTGKG